MQNLKHMGAVQRLPLVRTDGQTCLVRVNAHSFYQNTSAPRGPYGTAHQR